MINLIHMLDPIVYLLVISFILALFFLLDLLGQILASDFMILWIDQSKTKSGHILNNQFTRQVLGE